jgi:hypothetical protein
MASLRIHGRPEEAVEMTEPRTAPIQRIFEAISEASMCWIDGPASLEFDEQAAILCANDLIDDLRAMGVDL